MAPQGVQAVPQAVQTGKTEEDGATKVLLKETKEQQSEVKLEMTRMIRKLDDLTVKVEQLHDSNRETNRSLVSANSSPSMEAGILLHNIQRIMQDNERLKREVFEKSARIEGQNEKIAELLERNQRLDTWLDYWERCGLRWVWVVGMWSRVIQCWSRGMIHLS
jgi:FK506-binding protein 15